MGNKTTAVALVIRLPTGGNRFLESRAKNVGDRQTIDRPSILKRDLETLWIERKFKFWRGKGMEINVQELTWPIDDPAIPICRYFFPFPLL